MDDLSSHKGISSLMLPDIRLAVISIAFFTFAGRALAVVLAFQIYRITHSPLALGWLGLVEAIPAVATASFGGYVADHFSRQAILKIARSVSFICSLILLLLSIGDPRSSIAWLYLMIFILGIARGFADPATTGFEAQVVPKHLTVNAASWFGSTWILASIFGPGAIGFIFAEWGAPGSYGTIAACFLISLVFFLLIPPKQQVMPEVRENVLKSIRTGWRALLKIQPLFASMILDLFAVFFGGAVILLPVYAIDILKVGVRGLGLLNAAASLGALVTMLSATSHPPIKNAGRNLLWAVAGFGVSILVFAFSTDFWLSFLALFLSGLFDGLSMIVRRSIMRLLSPDHLRGRIAAAGSIFICASNELGAFESGMLASLIGTVPCVAAGGVVTLLVVGMTAALSDQLRKLKF
ncbi:MAG TPA: MFS transporter [Candidatus Omnitrophota bacterium]|nr:MFS transporter [Candidatus Omnitrophota bacterium]